MGSRQLIGCVGNMTTVQVVISGDSMWPTHKDGDSLEFTMLKDQKLSVGDLVVAPHPLKPRVQIVKRIAEMIGDSKLQLVGDNPDPLASEDSHNFGPVPKNSVIAYYR